MLREVLSLTPALKGLVGPWEGGGMANTGWLIPGPLPSPPGVLQGRKLWKGHQCVCVTEELFLICEVWT